MTAIDIFVDADSTPVNQRGSVYRADDFGSITGDLNWDVTHTGTPGTVTAVDLGSDYPGAIDIPTGTSANNKEVWQRHGCHEDKLQVMEWVFSLPAKTSEAFDIGAWSISPILEGWDVRFDTSIPDTNLSLGKWVGGVRTEGTTLAFSANDLIRVVWSRSGSGTGALVVNNLTAATNATYNISGLTAGKPWDATAQIQTLTTAAKSMRLDWFQSVMSGMSR